MQTKRIKAWLTVVALATLLAGCGFALRGNVAVIGDLQPIYIASDRESSELRDALARQFAINAVDVTTHRSQANLIVDLALLEPDTRSVALNNEARDAEYALFESARVSLATPDGKALKGPRTLLQRRIIVNDPDNPVGEETESEIVRGEMLEQLSIRIAQQVEYWAKQLGERP